MTRTIASAAGRLEAAIDEVVASYHSSAEINNLESAALPSRRAVIKAYDHLAQAIYLGFYSTRSLNTDSLRYAISEHLYPAHELLVEQLRRAVSYEKAQARLQVDDAAEFSEEAVLSLFRQLPEIRSYLNSDVIATYEGDPAAKSIEEVVFSAPGVRAMTAQRVAHALYRAGVPMIPRIITEHAHSETGIDIHAGAEIGPRFCIDHGTGLVVGETTKIGSNVKVYQGVTLGALSTARTECISTVQLSDPLAPPKKRHPTIEDDVTIYSGAKILGGDTVIGAGSVIGGNVWLVHSVPPNSRFFGRERDSVPLSKAEVDAQNGSDRPAASSPGSSSRGNQPPPKAR